MSDIINISELSEECIGNCIKKEILINRKIYIWGCNVYTRRVCKILIGMDLKIEGIVDNSPVKAGGVIENIKVVLPTEIHEEDCLVIFCLSRAIRQISAQLCDMGFVNSIIFNCRSGIGNAAEENMNFADMEQKLLEVGQHVSVLHKKYDNNLIILLYPFLSTGDAYLVSLYLKSYIQNRCYCILTTTKSSKIIFERFELYNIELVSSELMKWFCIYERFLHGYNNVLTIVPYHYTGSISGLGGIHNLHITDYYRTLALGLNRNIDEDFPKIREKHVAEKIDVILAPYANTLTGFPTQFWEEVAEKLISYGKTVYTNCGKDENEIAGTLPLKVSLAELDTLVDNSGIFVGIRSGVCDVVVHTKTPKIIIYPNQMKKHQRHCVSLKKFDDSVEELIYSNSRKFIDDLVKKIINKLEGNDDKTEKSIVE